MFSCFLCQPSPQVNPYLLPAVMLACGFWGIDSKQDPSKCRFADDVNMYDACLVGVVTCWILEGKGMFLESLKSFKNLEITSS